MALAAGEDVRTRSGTSNIRPNNVGGSLRRTRWNLLRVKGLSSAYGDADPPGRAGTGVGGEGLGEGALTRVESIESFGVGE
jgi:hypothetical protein